MIKFTKLSKLLMAASLAVVTALSSSAQVKLGANCIMSSIGYGMYTMDAALMPNFTRVAETEPFFGGAVYVNGKYYGSYYDYNYVGGEPQLTEVTWYVYDAVTWQLESKVTCPLDYTYIATDRTYDPSTGTVYSLVYDKTASAVWLATTNLQTGASTMIAPIENNVFTIASDSKGNLFGIDVYAKLYRIDSATGATTLVGPTGLTDYWSDGVDYQQSMAFDYETGVLYWAEFHAPSYFTSASAIYEVDTATGQATKYCDLPGGPELTGLYVLPSLPAGSPGVASNLKAETQSVGSTMVKFSFTAPVNDVDGKPLSTTTPITFELVVDNELVDIAELLPGANYTSEYINIAQGYHAFKVTGTNANGTGETAAEFFFSGYDVPTAPQGIRLKTDGVTASILWEPPFADKGAHGGPVRTPFTYNVTRYPGAVSVATGISETSFNDTPDKPALYYYEVQAVSQDGAGPAAKSNQMVIARFDTPYYCGFDNEDEFNLYTIVDVTSNGKVWNYDEDRACLRHPWSLYDPIDDYIISPAITLDGTKSYAVSFDAWQMVAGYDEHVMLYYGTSTDVNKMTLILDTEKLNEESTNYSAIVAAMQDGSHYFAFRSKTDINGFMSYVDNLRIVEAGLAAVPEKVGNLTVTAADGGKLEVEIEFDAPTVSLQGEKLASLSSIDIMRGESNEPIKTFAAPEPGAHLSWTDTSVKNGVYTYRIVASNSHGAGQETSAKVFAGVDVPMPVTDLTFSHEDGTAELEWEAPAQGVNGGNLNGLLTYDVTRYVNGEPSTVASNLKDTSFTESWQPDGQASVYYSVTAVTSAGRSEEVTTASYTAGDAYTIPFIESFSGGKPTNEPWKLEPVVGTDGGWAITTSGEYPWTSAQDGDGGMASFDGYHYWARNTEHRLVSPSISTYGYKDLTLTFYAYHYNGVDSWSGESEPVNETFYIEVSVNGAEFTKVPGTDFTLYSAKNGWEQHVIPFDAYKGQKDLRFAVRGKSAGCFNIHVDNFKLDGVSSVQNVSTNGAYIAAQGNSIIFSGLTAPLYIFNTAGMKVAQSFESEGSVTLESGFYIATSGDRSLKFVIR